jgi:plastocyanin
MIARTVPRLAAVLAIMVPALMFAAPGMPQAHAAGHAITMANYAFSPASETITVGDSVTWTNTDQAPHNITTTSAPTSIQSPTLTTGQSWSYTFATPGSYSYICSIHPDMRATLVVRPAVQPTAAAPPVAPVTRNTVVPNRTAPTVAPVVPPVGAAGPTPTSSTPPPTTSTTMNMAGAGQQQNPPSAAGAASGQAAGLNPLLLIAGLVAAVATLCLLLIGSRPEPNR